MRSGENCSSACAAQLQRVERVGLLERGRHLAVVVDDDPAAAVLDHLRHRAAARRDHRRAARHRLDHDQAERLLPVDREERRPRVLEQLDLLAVRDLAEVLDLVRAEMRLDELVEVLLLRPARASCPRSSAAARSRSRRRPRGARPCPGSSGRGRAGSRRGAAAPGRREKSSAFGQFATQGSRLCGLRWFIEIEISPVRGATARDLLVDLAALAVERPVHRVQARGRRPAPPITAAGRPEWSLITSNSSARSKQAERVLELRLRAADLARSARSRRPHASFAFVCESPDANSVTSCPASTSPSASSETIHSIPP